MHLLICTTLIYNTVYVDSFAVSATSHNKCVASFKGRLQWKNQLQVFCTTVFVYPCNAQKTFFKLFITIIDRVIEA